MVAFHRFERLVIFGFIAFIAILYLSSYGSQNQPNQTVLENGKANATTTPMAPMLADIYRTGRAACSYLPLAEKRTLPDAGHVCILIRSWYKHVNDTRSGLSTLYDCFEQFEYENWSSYVFYLDTHPVYDFHKVGDAREEKYRSKFKVTDTPYHKKWECRSDCGYTATDWAIYNVCPKDTRWLLVTSGDNDYAPEFLSHLDTEYDAIGFPFFSRYAHLYADSNTTQTGNMSRWSHPSCEKERKSACMVNRYAPDHNDLGSMIWNFQRWTTESRGYSKLNPMSTHDGSTAKELIHNAKWKLKEVRDCQYSHNPNPWSNCAKNQNRQQP